LADQRYRINSPHVVAETLDGEATIVDLENGTYYALNESGSFIWERLTRGSEPTDVAAGLASTYELDPERATEAVEELLVELSEHGLIVPASNGSNGSTPVAVNGAPAAGGAYAAPQLSTYTDMQELLLLDPIHEVDESGWPSQA
jgi:outer membrane protein assembly factor BamB